MKASLAELQSPFLSESRVTLLTQVESYFDQFGKDLQMLINNREQVSAQKMAQALLWERHNASNEKVEQMRKQSHDIVSGVNACKENIANWKDEITQLYVKIGILECK
ncbi:hypothetical protein A2U01_0052163, partial [Trifolium medium]|nr:hypothetical protein [Trifolium medium]